MPPLMLCLLTLSILSRSQAGQERHSFDDDVHNIERFSSYKKFIQQLQVYSDNKLKNSVDYIFHISKRNTSAFLSFVTPERFITLQFLYALSNKDVVYTNLLLHLSPSFQTAKPEYLRDWLNSNIDFCKKELYETVKFLVQGKEKGLLQISKYFADQIVFMNDKYKIFEEACSNGDKDIVEWFIKAGLNLETVSWNVLDNAFKRNQFGVLKVLLENNILDKVNLSLFDLNTPVNNKTLVHIASELGLPDSVVTLVKAGANVNAVNSKGETPLFSAVSLNQFQMLKILVNLGANLSATCKETGDSLLHLAASLGNVDAVGQLLQLGALPNVINYRGITPLYKAVENDDIKVIYVLGFEGGDLDFSTSSGDTLMHTACSINSMDAVKALTTLGAKIDERNNLDETPSFISAKKGNSDIINYLVSRGADLHKKDRKGLTLLHKAAKNGDLTATTTLMKSGMDVEVTGFHGITPLYSAVDEGHLHIIKLLLSRKANPNRVSDGGWSPLHRAALWGFEDIVTLLLKNGAKTNITTSKGMTPYGIAMDYGHTKVAKLIKSVMEKENPNIDV